MDLAFLPNVQESIMDELRTTEGMIFRDEAVKKLFLDSKYFCLDILYADSKSPEYLESLDAYMVWNEETSSKLVLKASLIKDIQERLTSVTILYAKYLYANSHPDKIVSIRKPKLENLLRGMLSRLSGMHNIRNGSFFGMDPLRQDFVIRDVFRQSLGNDCIEMLPETSLDSPHTVLSFAAESKNQEKPKTVVDESDTYLPPAKKEEPLYVLEDNQTPLKPRTILPEPSRTPTVILESTKARTILPEARIVLPESRSVLPEPTKARTIVPEVRTVLPESRSVVPEPTKAHTVLPESRTVLQEPTKARTIVPESRTVLQEQTKARTILLEARTVVPEQTKTVLPDSHDTKMEEAKAPSKAPSNAPSVVPEWKNQPLEKIAKDVNEVYPDDSISHVIERMASVAPTHVSKKSSASNFKMPTVRRVKIDEE